MLKTGSGTISCCFLTSSSIDCHCLPSLACYVIRAQGPKQLAMAGAYVLVQVGLARPETGTKARAAEQTVPLTRAEMCRQIEHDIDAKTTLLVETGDAWFNGMYRHLPDGARFEIEMQWGSIGWAVPATFGYGMALEPDRGMVAIIGDGSFQLTAQEVANMIRYGQKMLIFLVNNRGYVIESEIHEGPYNYFKNWDYAGLLSIFNAEKGRGLGLKATTAGELARRDQEGRQSQRRSRPDRVSDRS